MSKIWVVDDDLLTVEIIRNLLALQGIRISVFQGQMNDFLLWKKEDIVLFCLDYKGENSFSFIEQHSHPNYILMTQYESFAYAQWAVRQDVKDILLKPVQAKELKSSIERCLYPFTGDVVVDSILMELHQSYCEKIQMKEMAAKYFMQNSNFARLFKQKTGMTFKEYLWNLRLEKGVEEIAKGEESIGQIIERVCGEEPAAFYRQFRKKYGMSPKKYQNKIKIDKKSLKIDNF